MEIAPVRSLSRKSTSAQLKPEFSPLGMFKSRYENDCERDGMTADDEKDCATSDSTGHSQIKIIISSLYNK
jgi:hypothetical protein